MPLIEAHTLTKRFRLPVKAPGLAGALKHLARPRYEEKVAVDAIDLRIVAGESVGYVGPNGAGKSTTVKMSILYLDEPTIGLDIAVKERIRQFVKQINRERGVTVLLTSHDLGDIEDLCARLVMIDQGRIAFDGPLQAIRERFGRERVMHLLLRGAVPSAAETARGALPELEPDGIQQPEPHHLAIQFDAARLTAGVIAGRVLAALPIDDMRIEEPSIESIIFATNCIAFWDPSATANFPFMIQNFLEFAKFPLSLYDRFVQVLVTWALPFAFVSYYPGVALLGKAGANPWLAYLAPLAGPIAALVTVAIWRHGLRRYQGTGH